LPWSRIEWRISAMMDLKSLYSNTAATLRIDAVEFWERKKACQACGHLVVEDGDAIRRDESECGRDYRGCPQKSE